MKIQGARLKNREIKNQGNKRQEIRIQGARDNNKQHIATPY